MPLTAARVGPLFDQIASAPKTAANSVAPGIAHDLPVTSDVREFQYKCTDFHASDCERSIRWDDAELGIDWPVDATPLVSGKDGQAPSFRDTEYSD